MRKVKGEFCREHEVLLPQVTDEIEDFVPPGPASDVVYAVELTSIDLSENEPLRSGDWTHDDGFTELINSIDKIGQLSPAIIKSMSGSRKGKWQIVSGWRRFAAIKLLNEKNGTHMPLLAMVAADGDKSDLLTTAIASNTQQPMKAPDLAMALYTLSELYVDEAEHRAEGLRSDRDIADVIGLSRTHVSDLLRIARNVKLGLLKRWQSDYPMGTLVQMRKIAMLLPPEERDAAYDKIVTSRVMK